MSEIKSILLENQGLADEGNINYSKTLEWVSPNSIQIIGSSIGAHFTSDEPNWFSLCLSKNPIEKSNKYGGEKNLQTDVLNHCEHEGSKDVGGLEKHIINTIMFPFGDYVETKKLYLKAIVPTKVNSVKMWALIFYKQV